MLIVTLFYFIYKFEWFEKMSFVLVTSFFIYYLIYIFVPVAGPQFYFPAICLIPFYMLLCGATVYIQAHYVIDAIVGFFSAFVLYVVATWMFKKWFAQPMFK